MRKGVCSCIIANHEMGFADKADFAKPNHSKCHAPNIKMCASFCEYITTGTLVWIRLHKKADLLEMKVKKNMERFVQTKEAGKYLINTVTPHM